MKIKQIAFIAANEAILQEREINDSLPPHGIMIKVENTTISAGTERANLTGNVNVNAAAKVTSDVPNFPRYCGYSCAGTVFKIGSEVTEFKEGERVVTDCGFHAQYVTVPESHVHHVPDGISFNEASMSVISTFSIEGVRKTRVEVGESACVMGLGVLGIFSVQFFKAAGAVPVIAVDPVESRRNTALRLGADYALDPYEEGFTEKVKELTGGGINCAVEVTGRGEALNQVLDCMAKFGRITLLGCTRSSDFTVDYYRKVHFPGISLIGAHTCARPDNNSRPGCFTYRDDFAVIYKLIKGKRVNFKDMICEIHSPEDAPETFTRLATDKDFPCVVQFDWTKI